MPDKERFFSEEARDILGKIPSWTVRWGITVIFVIFAGILAGCYFIRYPDTVLAPVVVTAVNRPQALVARFDGVIDSVCVQQGQRVEKGAVIALLRNTANRRDIQTLERHLAETANMPCNESVTLPWLDDPYDLGEIQLLFEEFRQACRDYKRALAAEPSHCRQRLWRQQIARAKAGLAKLRQLPALPREQGTADDFQAAQLHLEMQILRNEQRIVDLAIRQENSRSEHERSIARNRKELLEGLHLWKRRYMPQAPISGRIAFLSHGRHVRIGDSLARIVPEGDERITGRIQIPAAKFGKVKPGQRVNVRLDGYPYTEYGVLKGTILYVCPVPEHVRTEGVPTAVYLADAIFPEGTTTSYKRELPSIEQMGGTAEIITDQKRLISRFIQPVTSLFDKPHGAPSSEDKNCKSDGLSTFPPSSTLRNTMCPEIERSPGRNPGTPI